MNVLDFQKMKNEGRKISVVTCYDYSSARAVAASNIDCILVGDSVAMVMHGHATTLSATTAMIALHTAAVARGAPKGEARTKDRLARVEPGPDAIRNRVFYHFIKE